jgi:hypothetical protein
MVIFIDESGVHKEVGKSTFVLVYIEVKNLALIEKEILDIEKSLRVKFFHWRDHSWKIKEKFVREALKLKFTAKIFVVKNPMDLSVELERSLDYLIVERNIKNIYIDGKKSKRYENKFKNVLRRKGIKTRKLRTVRSSQCPGVRLADMVAGLSRAFFEERNLGIVSKFYKKLERKSEVIVRQ